MAMAAVKPKDKKSRKNLLLRLVLGVMFVSAVVSLVEMQVNLGQRERELAEIEARVEEQRLANKELERELSVELDEDYIERYARDYLDYVAPGERVFIDISGS